MTSDKFLYDNTEAHINPNFEMEVYCNKGYKEWMFTTLWHMWHQSANWSVVESKSKWDKIKALKDKRLHNSTSTAERTLSLCNAGLL